MRKHSAALLLAAFAWLVGPGLEPAAAAKVKIITLTGAAKPKPGKGRRRTGETNGLAAIPADPNVPPPPPRTEAKALMAKGTAEACQELQAKVARLTPGMSAKEIRALLERRPDWTLLRNDRKDIDGDWRAGDFEAAVLVYHAGGHPIVISLDRKSRLQFVNGSATGWAEEMQTWNYCGAAYDSIQLPIDRVACRLHPKRTFCG